MSCNANSIGDTFVSDTINFFGLFNIFQYKAIILCETLVRNLGEPICGMLQLIWWLGKTI
jgi:hypothetical protein